MKKILTILSSLTVLATGPISVISCTIKQGAVITPDNLLYIGKDIDKSKAIDDSKDNLQFSNYFVLGDSLSDSHGLEKLIKTKANINLKLGTDNNDPKNYQNGSFTNGKTAAVLLNDKLGFDEINPGIPGEYGQSVGRNYAIGGATAADSTGMMGMFLNDVTIDKQARALVEQHKLQATDLVFLEIGGNDLFQMMDQIEPSAENAIMTQSIERIKTAFFTLLNNGVRKIIFSDAPNIKLVPRYANASISDKIKAHDLSTEFHVKTKQLVALANHYYQNSIREWGFYDNLPILMSDFKAKYSDAILDVNFNTLNMDISEIMNTGILNATPNTVVPPTDDITKYFFFDEVHPTKEIYELAYNYYYNLIKEWK